MDPDGLAVGWALGYLMGSGEGQGPHISDLEAQVSSAQVAIEARNMKLRETYRAMLRFDQRVQVLHRWVCEQLEKRPDQGGELEAVQQELEVTQVELVRARGGIEELVG